MTEKEIEEEARRVEALEGLLSAQQEQLETLLKERHKTMRELAKAKLKLVVPSERAIQAAKRFGPMDDIFFNKIGEDADAIREELSRERGQVSVRGQYAILDAIRDLKQKVG